MYICICNPFSDSDVREYLSGQTGKAAVSQTYRHCSGGEKPCCGNCLPELRDMVRTHNAAVTVRAMEQGLPETERARAPQGEKNREAA